MKNFKILLLLVVVGLFAACSEDENPDQLILGTWDVTAFNGNGSIDIQSPDFNLLTNISSVGSAFNSTITFNGDGTFNGNGDYTNTITYTSGTIVDVETGQENLFGNGTYTITDEKLTIIEDSEIIVFDIDNFSSSSLSISTVIDETDTYGAEVTKTNISYNIDLTK